VLTVLAVLAGLTVLAVLAGLTVLAMLPRLAIGPVSIRVMSPLLAVGLLAAPAPLTVVGRCLLGHGCLPGHGCRGYCDRSWQWCRFLCSWCQAWCRFGCRGRIRRVFHFDGKDSGHLVLRDGRHRRSLAFIIATSLRACHKQCVLRFGRPLSAVEVVDCAKDQDGNHHPTNDAADDRAVVTATRGNV